jgi:hypothetical protein
VVDRVVEGTVPASVLGGEGQFSQADDRSVDAQHRIGQLEQRVRPPGQTLIERYPEPRQLPERTGMAGVVHTDQLKPLVVIVLLSQEE